MIKFLNAQSIAAISIYRQMCQVYGHTQLDGQHNFCRSSAGKCLIIIHPIARTSRPVISTFSYTSRNPCPVSVSVFQNDRETEMRITDGRLLRHRIQKLVPRYDKCLNSGGEYVEKWLNTYTETETCLMERFIGTNTVLGFEPRSPVLRTGGLTNSPTETRFSTKETNLSLIQVSIPAMTQIFLSKINI